MIVDCLYRAVDDVHVQVLVANDWCLRDVVRDGCEITLFSAWRTIGRIVPGAFIGACSHYKTNIGAEAGECNGVGSKLDTWLSGSCRQYTASGVFVKLKLAGERAEHVIIIVPNKSKPVAQQERLNRLDRPY